MLPKATVADRLPVRGSVPDRSAGLPSGGAQPRLVCIGAMEWNGIRNGIDVCDVFYVCHACNVV